MPKMSQIETIVNAYKTLSKIPSIVNGRLNSRANQVTAKWTVRNLDKCKQTKYLYNYFLDDQLNVVAESDFGIDVSNEILSAVSPKGKYRALIREEKNEKKEKKQFFEVWQANRLRHSVDLTALDLHGDIYNDSEFTSFNWNQDETAVLYIAEKKHKKSEPYIKRKPVTDDSDNGSDEVKKQGEEYLYRQDWGEQLVGKYYSVIVMARIEDESFTILKGLPKSWCPGQVSFSPDGLSVVGVAWETVPRRLGLRFCSNRPGYLFQLTLEGQLTKITDGEVSVCSPRVRADGELVWLQRDAGGPHHACHALYRRRINSDTKEAVIDVVDREVSTADGQVFHGVYGLALPQRCFSADGARVLFSTPQKHDNRAYVVDLDGGRLVDISYKGVVGSTTVLDVCNDVILAVCSNLTTPGRLFIARLPAKGDEINISWKAISEPIEVPASIASTIVEHLTFEHENSQDDVKSFSALYSAPRGELLPLVVWPHGGPHSAFVDAYSIEAAFYTMLGFACLQINYRGSIGSGQASIQFLLSRIGDADVKDCKLATDHAMRYPNIDNNNVCLTGGSHGGFLVTHLCGQYPDVYRTVIARNPVIDVASMFNSTDIADWCAVESGFEFTERGPVSEEQLVSMRRASPLAHAHRAVAPLALLLGSKDLRVPYHQGMEYARRLAANGVETRVYMYDDNHSLSSFAAEMDSMINGAAWLLEHLKS